MVPAPDLDSPFDFQPPRRAPLTVRDCQVVPWPCHHPPEAQWSHPLQPVMASEWENQWGHANLMGKWSSNRRFWGTICSNKPSTLWKDSRKITEWDANDAEDMGLGQNSTSQSMKSLIRQIQLCQPDIELSGLTAGDDIRPWGANLDKHYPRGKESLDVGKGTCTPPRQAWDLATRSKQQRNLPQGLGKQYCYSLILKVCHIWDWWR